MDGKKGYTLVEVMVFLAVSVALLGSATNLISSRRKSINFSQGMRELEQRVQSVATEVSSGYFPNYRELSCVAGASGPVVSNNRTAGEIGQSRECILLGKVVHFGPSSGKDFFNVYSVVGLSQELASGIKIPVTSYYNSRPTVVSAAGITQRVEIPAGIEIHRLSASDDSAIGFFSALSGGSLASNITRNQDISVKFASGSQVLRPVLFDGVNYQTSEAGATTTISDRTIYSSASTNNQLSICFRSPDTDKLTAKLTIGGGNQGISTRLEFVSC